MYSLFGTSAIDLEIGSMWYRAIRVGLQTPTSTNESWTADGSIGVSEEEGYGRHRGVGAGGVPLKRNVVGDTRATNSRAARKGLEKRTRKSGKASR